MDVKKLNSTDLKNYIEIEQPDVVVVIFDYHIPLHDAGANKEINNIFNIVREKEIISVLGGKAATFYEATKLINLKADIFIKHDMEKPLNDFVSHEKKNFKWHIGKTLASSLSGFIVGIIVSIIFFFSVFGSGGDEEDDRLWSSGDGAISSGFSSSWLGDCFRNGAGSRFGGSSSRFRSGRQDSGGIRLWSRHYLSARE